MPNPLNISDPWKHIADGVIQTSDSNENKNLYLLLITLERLKLEKYGVSVSLTLQKEPCISAALNFKLEYNALVQGSMSLSSKQSFNSQYEVTFYHMNAEQKLQLVDKFDISYAHMNFNFLLKERVQIYTSKYYRSSNEYEYYLNYSQLFNGLIAMYCKVTKKNDPIPVALTLKKEMPLKMSYKDSRFSDFTIICENEKFYVHKVILASKSSVFSAMFEHDMTETQTNEVEINDFNSKTVEQMVHYIYNDETQENLSFEELKNLVMIAEKYDLSDFKLLCVEELITSVKSLTKAFELVSFAEKHNITNFNERMAQHIKDNSKLFY